MGDAIPLSLVNHALFYECERRRRSMGKDAIAAPSADSRTTPFVGAYLLRVLVVGLA